MSREKKKDCMNCLHYDMMEGKKIIQRMFILHRLRKENNMRKNIQVKVKKLSTGNTALTISDNGEGILPDVLDKIFVPFFTTKTSGSGIGLSLCKQIMTLHEGSINVKSEVGKGSSFILTFPK